VEIVTAESTSSSNSTHQVDATCPAGKRVIGGGARSMAPTPKPLSTRASGGCHQVERRAYEVNATADNWHVVAFAVCAVAS
jgi:hypothetical protein